MHWKKFISEKKKTLSWKMVHALKTNDYPFDSNCKRGCMAQ